MRALALALVAALVACTSPTPVVEPTPKPTHEPNTVAVSALLDLSGGRASIGQAQRNGMQLWLDQVQGRTPGQVRLRVKFVDVAGSDVRLLLELRHAVVDDGADAIVVGTTAVLDETFMRAAELAAVPLLLTLPTVAPMPAAAGWVFALAPTAADVAAALADDMIERDAPPALIVSDGSRAGDLEQQALIEALTRRGRLRPEVMSVTEASADRVRRAVTAARTVAFTGPSSAHLDVLRATRSDTTRRTYLSYLTEAGDLADLRGSGVMWPGSRHLVPASTTNSERVAFIRSFTDRSGVPSTAAGSAYDALALIDAAAELAPSELDPARLRQRLETRTFAGVVSDYVLSATDHAAFAAGDVVVLTPDVRGDPVFAPSPTPRATASPGGTP